MEYNYVTCLADVSILLPTAMVDNCISRQWLSSCSVTRPFLSLRRVWLARLKSSLHKIDTSGFLQLRHFSHFTHCSSCLIWYRYTSTKTEHAYSKFTSFPSFLNGASSKASTSRSSAILSSDFFGSAVEAWMITGKSGSKVSLMVPCISPTTVCQFFSRAS